MLFNLLLANITILLCFFFFCVCCFQYFFIIPVVIENAKQKLALAIPTSDSITVANDAIDIPPLVADKSN